MKKLIKTLVLITIVSQSSFAQTSEGIGHVTLLKKNASMQANTDNTGSTAATSVNQNSGNSTSGGTNTNGTPTTPIVEGKKHGYVGHVTLLK